MFRQAISEVRLHPGRFVSTLVAIAISVAFLAGSAIMVETEGAAQALNNNRPLSKADVVVSQADAKTVTAMGTVEQVAVAAPVIAGSLLLTGTNGTSEMVMVVGVVPPELRWAELTAGTWPQGPSDLVLTTSSARTLNVGLGGQIRSSGEETLFTVVGLTDEPSSTFIRTGYASNTLLDRLNGGEPAQEWALLAKPGVSADQLAQLVRAAVIKVNPEVSVRTGEQARAEAVKKTTGGFAAFTYLLWAFAGVALVVGMITIANTFTITLAQRRRQIGLLRAVGASGGQIRGRFLAEAAILGGVGSILGMLLGAAVATAGATWTGAIYWGLSFPLAQLAFAFGVGVVATVGAALVPIIKGARVAPLEALQPVPSQGDRRRATVFRSAFCALLLLAGGGGAVASFQLSSIAFPVAIAAGVLIALGVLLGAPIFVPPLLKVVGAMFRWISPVASLAADNAERNPRRAAATASALMLAIGLIVTLQVAATSVRITSLDELERDYPVDVSVTWRDADGRLKPIPSAQRQQLTNSAGVGGSVLLSSGTAELTNSGDSYQLTLIGYDPASAAITAVQSEVADDVILVNHSWVKDFGKKPKLSGSAGSARLNVVASKLADSATALVSQATLAKITKPAPGSVMWLSVPDRAQAVNVAAAVTSIAGPTAEASGSIVQAALYEQVLGVLLAITTALLGVAVLIALVGVSNTLGLSVLERQRESALLRALGLQARALRGMLTIEAIQVSVVGVAVGVVAGGFFGWLAASTMAISANLGTAKFGLDLPQTLIMIATAMAAAALASVLPGRRAAKAAPTEALADI